MIYGYCSEKIHVGQSLLRLKGFIHPYCTTKGGSWTNNNNNHHHHHHHHHNNHENKNKKKIKIALLQHSLLHDTNVIPSSKGLISSLLYYWGVGKEKLDPATSGKQKE